MCRCFFYPKINKICCKIIWQVNVENTIQITYMKNIWDVRGPRWPHWSIRIWLTSNPDWEPCTLLQVRNNWTVKKERGKMHIIAHSQCTMQWVVKSQKSPLGKFSSTWVFIWCPSYIPITKGAKNVHSVKLNFLNYFLKYVFLNSKTKFSSKWIQKIQERFSNFHCGSL